MREDAAAFFSGGRAEVAAFPASERAAVPLTMMEVEAGRPSADVEGILAVAPAGWLLIEAERVAPHLKAQQFVTDGEAGALSGICQRACRYHGVKRRSQGHAGRDQ